MQLVNGLKADRESQAAQKLERLIDLWLRTATKAAKECEGGADRWTLCRAVFASIRGAALMWRSGETFTGEEVELLLACIARLSPREFTRTFTPAKTYERGEQGYAGSMAVLQSLPQDVPIGSNEAAARIVLDYDNGDINAVAAMLIRGAAQRYEETHGESLFEMLYRISGKELPTSCLHTDAAGRSYVIANGTAHRVRKARARHLRLV